MLLGIFFSEIVIHTGSRQTLEHMSPYLQMGTQSFQSSARIKNSFPHMSSWCGVTALHNSFSSQFLIWIDDCNPYWQDVWPSINFSCYA